jgi:membrane protease YdiL (CAAX protease family)
MGFQKIKNSKQVFYVMIIAIAGLYISGALASLTQLLPIPQKLNTWALDLEETYKKAMGAITQMKTINELLVNIILVALIPAVVEELYFRGGLQKIMKDWSGNPWIAIIITAIIFSAFHFSFFGFLSRMALGIILGCIYEYTKSIWLPILLHFINNGVAITGLYLVRNDIQKTKQLMDEGMPIYYGAIALVLVVFILIHLKKDTQNERLENDIRK